MLKLYLLTNDINTELNQGILASKNQGERVKKPHVEMNEVYRQRLYFESGKAIPQTLRGFINFLRTVQFDPEKEFYEIEIPVATSPISAEDARALTTFPFEFQLLQRGVSIVALTGTREQPMQKNRILKKR